MSRALRYGRWIVASFGAASATLVVTHCATSTPTGTPIPKNANTTIFPPDFTPMFRWDSNWDRRDPRFLKHRVFDKPSGGDKQSGAKKGDTDGEANLKFPKARRNIILVRHGQYNQNGEDDLCHTLTKLGEEQAALAGQRLKNTGIKFNSIVSSGMTRAIQTAEIILKQFGETDLKLDINDTILNEGPPCIPEPPYRNTDVWDPDFDEFYEHGARIEAAFRKYFHRADLDQEKDSYEIIVCHGNVIRYFSLRALQFPPEGWLRITVDHTSLTKISLLPDGDVILRGLGDSGHLPVDKATA